MDTSMMPYYDKQAVLDWINMHEYAWEDFTHHFHFPFDVDYDEIEISLHKIVDWIAEHEQLFNDFLTYFSGYPAEVIENMDDDAKGQMLVDIEEDNLAPYDGEEI